MEKTNKSLFTALFHNSDIWSRGCTIRMLLSVFCAVISVVSTLLLPIYVGKAIDTMTGTGRVDFGLLSELLLFMTFLIVLGGAAQLLMGRLNTHISNLVTRRLRDRAFSAITGISIAEADSRSHGDLESRIINDADAVGDGLLLGLSQLFTGVLTILGTIGFLFSISYQIAPIVVILTPMSLMVARFISSRSAIFFKEQAFARGELTEFCGEQVAAAGLLRAYCAGNHSIEQFEELNKKLNDVSLKAVFYSSLPNPSSRFVNNIIYMAVGAIGALFAISGGITIGGLTSFLSYASGYAKPFNEITGVITELQNAIICLGRLSELINLPPESETGDKQLTSVRGDVTFEDVEFSYNKDMHLISGLNLSVSRGTKVAIVGPTGAGKTTLVNLLMRFYDTNSGSILIDGIDTHDVKRSSLRSSFGMVLQDVWIREGTVLFNLTLGRDNILMEDVIRSARLSHAHDFIMRLPHGYDTMLSSDGSSLSQGEKQLICITRVMLMLPPMLILDEATSSIDTRTEQRIGQTFLGMMQGRTTFIVAHRLSTIRNSDLILYMEHGAVKEQGTHEELLNKKGGYAALYNSSRA